MSLEQQMKSGLLYREYGHKDEKDIAYEKVIERQRKHGKEAGHLPYNQTNPSDLRSETGSFCSRYLVLWGMRCGSSHQ